MDKELNLLESYFQQKEDVVLAFLYGSFSKDRVCEESDIDIAVYIKENRAQIDDIWSDVTSLVNREVDLVDMKEAPATLVSNIIKTGIPLTIKDRNLYWNVSLEKSLEAEDFCYFLEDFRNIYQKAKSLIPEEKTRLLERTQFLESEFEDIDDLRQLTFKEYQDDKVKRRNIERWTENILNATIDIAKIVLASEKQKMPKTYEQALFNFILLTDVNEKEAKIFSRLSNLRNILAHEYLDILYQRIQDFISQAPDFYTEIFSFLKKYLDEE